MPTYKVLMFLSVVFLASGCTTTDQQIRNVIDRAAWASKGSDMWNKTMQDLIEFDRTSARKIIAWLPDAWYIGKNFREHKDERNNIRLAAATLLGTIRYKPAAATLLPYLSDAYPDDVRKKMAWALGEIENEAIEPENIDALFKSDNYELHMAAAVALCKLGYEYGCEALIEGLKREDSNDSRIASDGIKDAGHHSVRALVSSLGDKENKEIGENIQDILRDMRDALITDLKSDDDSVRRNSARALGPIGDMSALDPLLPLLNDEENMVQLWAATSLSQLGNKKGTDYLLNALKSQDNISRFSAIDALIEAGSTLEHQLISTLKDSDALIRSSAAQALGRISAKGAVFALIEALGDTSAAVRWNAALALGKIGDKQALEPLRDHLNDSDKSVSYYAEWASNKIEKVADN